MIEQFWVFHCGLFRLPENLYVNTGRWDMRKMPVLAGVALHKELGPLVIDAPFGHEGPANLGVFAGDILRKVSMEFEEHWAIVPRVEELGFRAADVDHILMTHLHFDHTGGMKSLGHARFHISQNEWDYIHGMTAQKAALAGYIVRDFRALYSRIKRHKFTDELSFPAGIDIFGDSSVEMIALPGHTPGHVGYRFLMSDGRRILYIGDAAFTLEQIYGDLEPGLMPRYVATDYNQSLATLHALRQYAVENPDDIILSSHDVALGHDCMEEPLAIV